ncbi:hypothetical protein LCGC14_0358830 [marine sediment metagenome]|uniref:Uncharacterized protein n=1 Tax=marine sediment metagenome TaxID=412755 RepID=A0A0F9WGU3_9ZZZZ
MSNEKHEIELIETHIEMLIDEEILKKIGANKLPHRDLHHRVMRIFAEHNTLRTRIEKMSVNGLSPESRLSGYAVIGKRQVERIKELCEQLAEAEGEIERLKKAVQYCRNYWGEDDGIHDCTGKSCVICNIEQALKGESK